MSTKFVKAAAFAVASTFAFSLQGLQSRRMTSRARWTSCWNS